jgi:hypothetical protein
MVAARILPVQIHFEMRLQAALEEYLRALRERIPAIIELKGSLPVNFWTQEEKVLAKMLLPVGTGEFQATQWARTIISVLAARVNELLIMESQREISLDMLRYELRIGPLSDARAERLALQQANRAVYANQI